GTSYPLVPPTGKPTFGESSAAPRAFMGRPVVAQQCQRDDRGAPAPLSSSSSSSSSTSPPCGVSALDRGGPLCQPSRRGGTNVDESASGRPLSQTTPPSRTVQPRADASRA